MKKLMMLFVAALTLSSVATAQFRLDVEGNKKKIASSDSDIQNSNKAAKANTWVTRGNVYYAADVAPTAPLYRGMNVVNINLLVGRPTETKEEVIDGNPFEVWVYPHFDLYLYNGELLFWKQKTFIVQNGLDVAFEAYTKAAELDSRQAAKMKAEVEKLANQYKQYADNFFRGGDYAAAGRDFARAYEITASPLMNQPDTLSAFNAGYLADLAEDYDTALKYLDIVEKMGYYGEDGEVYYYQYIAYYFGSEDVANSERVLREGIQKFPGNSQLIEALILLYTTTGQDASQIIPMVEEALKNDPTNYVFHFGLGLINDRLGDYAKAADEFKKAADLNPEDYASAFNLGLTYLRQADAMLPEINAIPINERELYNQKLGEFNTLYKQAIPYLERAYTLNPTEQGVVEMLRSIYFRFRDEGSDMMQNYEKYDGILKNM